jgi:cyclophilin family peptidyl-prolyl cis-trans isomerase
MQKINLITLFCLYLICPAQSQSSGSSSDLYSNLSNNQFLLELHDNPTHISSLLDSENFQQEILFDFASSHGSDEIASYLKDCITLQKNKNPQCLYAYSQQKNIGLLPIISSIELNNEYSDDWKSLLGKCVRNEEEAAHFSTLKMDNQAFCKGAFYCLRNGQFSESLNQRLLKIFNQQILHHQDITDVCRSIKYIPTKQFPTAAIDSIISIAPIALWNNRMAIQMLGKSKSSLAIQSILNIACSAQTPDNIVVECLLQLQRKPDLSTQEITSLLNHRNPEIVGLTIDCLALQKQFQIPISQIITSNFSENKSIPQELFWKVKSFEIQNPNSPSTLVNDIWKSFVVENNPYHRMLALEAIQKEPSLFQPLLEFVLNSNTYTDLYYGTSCLIAMSDGQQKIDWLEKLWEKNDEGIDALLYEYMREKISDPAEQQIWKTKILSRINQYTLPKMIETRNEALTTLELWGEKITADRSFPSGMEWTPEDLTVLPQEMHYEMIVQHDQEIDTLLFLVHKNGTPLTALHFAKLVDAHFYDHKFFHRRVSNFVLQGGCPRGDGMGSLDYTIASEFTPEHFSKGQIGWASAGPHTESCQIFFMLDEAYHLDGRYTNMGKITKGLERLNSLPLGTGIVSIRKVN